jgi:hypothetical protein
LIRKKVFLSGILLSIVFVLFCGNHFNKTQLLQIQKAGKEVIRCGEFGSQKQLPDAIKVLKPIKVILRDEGLYIILEKTFVEESGLFVPRNSDRTFLEQGDPSYKLIGDSIYSFHIKG